MTNFIKGFWRLLQPTKTYLLKYPLQIWIAYIRFVINFKTYKRIGGSDAAFRYVSPVLNFKQEDIQSGGGHYFYQDIWALRKLAEAKPSMHYDIGSRFDGFVGQATAISPITSVDIRPPAFQLPNFHFIQGDILNLPFKDNEVQSLSCLHTIEHIGLGRYGDDLNPHGFEQSLAQLQRVVAPGCILLLSMPVGIERTEFNAQRVLNPLRCIKYLNQMELLEFSIVNDANEFVTNVDPELFINQKYACGMYLFRKKCLKP